MTISRSDDWRALLSWLTENQRKMALGKGYFDLAVRERVFRIILYTGIYNVLEMGPDREWIALQYCLTTDGGQCIPGMALAQAMTLLLDTETFMNVSNRGLHFAGRPFSTFEEFHTSHRAHYLPEIRAAAREMGITQWTS